VKDFGLKILCINCKEKGICELTWLPNTAILLSCFTCKRNEVINFFRRDKQTDLIGDIKELSKILKEKMEGDKKDNGKN
jgi:hypothetical protein